MVAFISLKRRSRLDSCSGEKARMTICCCSDGEAVLMSSGSIAGCLPAFLVPDAMANETDVRKKEDEMPSERIVNVECVEHLMKGFGGLPQCRHWCMSG